MFFFHELIPLHKDDSGQISRRDFYRKNLTFLRSVMLVMLKQREMFSEAFHFKSQTQLKKAIVISSAALVLVTVLKKEDFVIPRNLSPLII